jgi:hypothetical protein
VFGCIECSKITGAEVEVLYDCLVPMAAWVTSNAFVAVAISARNAMVIRIFLVLAGESRIFTSYGWYVWRVSELMVRYLKVVGQLLNICKR